MPFTVPNEIVPAETEQDTIFGMEASQFRFVFTIFVAVFLSPLFSQVKTTQARHLFSLVPGLVMNFFIYGLDGIHPIIMTGYCYLIMRYVRSVYMPHIFFVISMAHLTYGQIYRYKYLYLIYTFDWTASTMLIAFRLAGAAWAVRDGRVILQEQQQQQQQMASAKAVEEGVSGDPTASRRVNKKDPYSLLTAQQKELAVMRDMTLLEVFGLSFFFPGFTAGPYPEAKRYIEFCERTGMFAAAPSPFKMSNRGIRQKVGEFVVSALVFATVSDTLSEDTLREESFVQKTNVFERILFMIVSVNVGSCKYYIVWSLGELGHILSGISYDGVDASGREKWDGCLQMDLKKFYTFKTCREVTSSWNKVKYIYIYTSFLLTASHIILYVCFCSALKIT